MGRLVTAFVCLLGSAGIALAFPQIVRHLLDAAFISSNSSLLNRIAIGLLVLFAIQALLNFVQVYLLTSTSELVIAKLREDLFARLILLSPGFFTERRTGELTSRLSADTTVLQTVLSYNLSEFARQTLFLIGGIVLLTLTHPTLTATTLSVVPIVVGAARPQAGKHRSAGPNRRSDRHCRRSILTDSDSAKLHGRSGRSAEIRIASR